jgi:hypothetical protein
MRSGTEVIDISSSSDEDASPLSRPSRKRPFHLITTDSSETDYSEDDYDDEDNDSEVIQGPLCKKKLKDGRKFENSDDDDCIILDSDPEKTDIILSPHISASLELLITAERGHVCMLVLFLLVGLINIHVCNGNSFFFGDCNSIVKQGSKLIVRETHAGRVS